MAISMAGCGISGTAHETASAETTVQSGQPDKTESSSAAASQTEPMVGMPDPFTPCESMKDAEQLVGFSVTLPDSITGYDAPELSVIKDEQLIQADYQKGDQRLYIRKAVGTEDISGDYNHYPEETTLAVGNRSVTMREKMARSALQYGPTAAIPTVSAEQIPLLTKCPSGSLL